MNARKIRRIKPQLKFTTHASTKNGLISLFLRCGSICIASFLTPSHIFIRRPSLTPAAYFRILIPWTFIQAVIVFGNIFCNLGLIQGRRYYAHKGRRQKSGSFGWCAPQSQGPPTPQAVMVTLTFCWGFFFWLRIPLYAK